jgi:uncharacterized repeat protein (TIGR04138 family)
MTEDAVTRILRRDPRYARAAYEFVRHALREAIDQEEPQHVTARELLVAIRTLARQQFGPLARTVLHDWGINSTEDFGHVVFNLIDEKELGKTDDDRISDFVDVYELDDAFPSETGDVRVHVARDDLYDEEDDEHDEED